MYGRGMCWSAVVSVAWHEPATVLVLSGVRYMKFSNRPAARKLALLVLVTCSSAVLVTGCGGAQSPSQSPSAHIGGPIGAPDAGNSVVDQLFGSYTPPSTSGVSDLSSGGGMIAAGYDSVPGASTLDDAVLSTTGLSDDENPLASGLSQMSWDSVADQAQEDSASMTNLSLDDDSDYDMPMDDSSYDDPSFDQDPMLDDPGMGDDGW